jgi:simple sugar transport system substrate-binding protein
MRVLRVLLSALVVLTVVVPLSTPLVAAQEPIRPSVNIYYVSHGGCSFDYFWCVVERGAKEAAKDLGVDLTLITPEKFNLEQTAQDIDRAIGANPDGLAVTVTDPVLFREPLMRAIESGIPVIAFNAADWSPKEERIPYLTFIGQDEYLAGYQAGKRLTAAHGGTRGVCPIQQVGHVTLETRCRGFADALAEAGLESEVLAISDDPAESATVMGDYFAANPDVDLWMCLGPSCSNAFYQFMESAGLEKGDIFQGTFDLSPEINEKMLEGVTDFGIDQQPYLQGYLSVAWLTWIARYGLYPPSDITYTGPGFVTPDNLGLVEDYAGTYR